MGIMNEQSKIVVFGGGRWARVLLGVFLKNTGSSVSYDVHTRHFAKDMRLWVNENGVGNRVFVSDGVANLSDITYLAAVVVNAASEHKKTAENALAAKVPVLIEKPMTESFAETVELIESAKLNNTLLVPSWVFMHATYIDNFIKYIKDVQEVYFYWTDEFDASRYGERKGYDSAVPIFKDVLPHVMSILSKILKSQVFELKDCTVSRGGCHVEMSIFISNVKCNLMLERDSTKRRREIFIEGEKDVKLDFSTEPGTICTDGLVFSGDIYWNSSPSPLEKMVNVFLSEVNSIKIDQEPIGRLALPISKLIDQIEPAYRKSLDKWVMEHISQEEIEIRDIRYFVSELVRGVMKVPYNKSSEVIKWYIDAICSGQLLKNFQNSSAEVLDGNIIKYIKSLKAGL